MKFLMTISPSIVASFSWQYISIIRNLMKEAYVTVVKQTQNIHIELWRWKSKDKKLINNSTFTVQSFEIVLFIFSKTFYNK